ncbi:L-threonylcarbamoyladenylate synthase [Oscillatoria sp. CS-180]|uniref:L-threonylcarbamoyladenylate synthase n=1 Tax=Oscillatoria sp. CS-180 TaxID=3021720 RepID=UPI00232B23EC|nr:L-threonylcarbamoyladenylate synthase [Oscillatoria sp. CS-180]MDB9525733.1 L-threonylcarbamoyladenylate synthase [Oscillatoria sp. CS-180]
MTDVSVVDFVTQIRSGEALASFPTDTVPALAARPDQSERIYATKERPADKPLILMGANLADLLPYVSGRDDELSYWHRITERYWPGALTLVLPASDRVPPQMNPLQTGTIGIRVPNHALARYLLARTGPLATTSVNRSGQPALETMADIAAQFPELLLLSEAAIANLKTEIGDFTLAASGVPSTVVRWHQGDWQVLRQGAVRME